MHMPIDLEVLVLLSFYVSYLEHQTNKWNRYELLQLLHDFLFYDRAKNKVFPVKRSRRGVKEAILQYRVERVAEWEGIGTVSFAAIRPLTGRTHQIRVQFSSRGHAVLGDRRYGAPPLPGKFEKGAIMLACRKITIPEKEKPADTPNAAGSSESKTPIM